MGWKSWIRLQKLWLMVSAEKYSHPVCAITPYKSSLNLLSNAGTRLEDPHRLFSGSGKKARHEKIINEGNANHPGCQHDFY